MQNRWFVVAVLLAWSAPAHAGRSYFGWLYSTEVMSERRVELQTWVFEEDGKVGNTKQTSLWSAPLVGITDQLELALPIEMGSTGADMEAQTFALQRVGIEARYRLVPAEVNEEPVFAPLIRVAAKRDVIVRNDVRLEADLVGSYESGAVQILADAGVTADFTPGNQHVEVRDLQAEGVERAQSRADHPADHHQGRTKRDQSECHRRWTDGTSARQVRGQAYDDAGFSLTVEERLHQSPPIAVAIRSASTRKSVYAAARRLDGHRSHHRPA